ncbi:MAG TPA: GNAT family N-acetyltransferase [Gammaproteobacteria bacterium]|nr:GNAT family N-acetyltransferase [Gammaproteobacteria bacterium]
MIIETVEDVARFETLREEWDELLRASSADCVFLTWEWLHTWWRHLAGGRKLHLILVRNEDGRLIALAPLARRPRQWKRLLPFPALEFLGVGSVGSDYLDIIIRRGEERRAQSALAGELAGSGLMVDFSQVASAGCRALDLMGELGGRGWRAHITPTDRCPYIDFSGDLPEQTWESYLSGLGSAHRYNLRRRAKNLEKQWRVDFERAATEEQRAAGIENVVRLHGLRWRSRGEPGVFGDPAVIAFHHEFSRLALARGWLRLYLLRLDDRIAVAWYGFHYNGVTSFYQTGFDPDFYKHSVGLVMMSRAIRCAIEEGASAYDFLRGDETYKSLWACRERELVRLELFPPSRRGAFCRQAMELRVSIKNGILRSRARPAAAASAVPE